MKFKFKTLCIAIIFLLLFVASEIYIGAESESVTSAVYIVEADGDKYTASKDSDIYSFESLNTLIDALGADGAHFEFRDIITDEMNISGNITLSGTLTVSGGNVSVSSRCIFNKLHLNLNSGALRIKGGEVSLNQSIISAGASSAVILDYSSSSVLMLNESEISSSYSGGAIECRMGSVIINSGSVKNPYGFAVVNSATLCVGGTSTLEGYTADVKTERPIHLTSAGRSFTGNLEVMYEKSFEKGDLEEIFLDASESIKDNLILYDLNGERIEITYFESTKYSEEKSFFGVYMPYRVKFYAEGELYHTENLIKDEPLFSLPSAQITGYSFDGWYHDATFTNAFVPGTAPNADISLYASFSLNLPEFSISSVEFVYDANARELKFERLSHPLSSEGEFSFVWYKNGERLNVSSDSVTLLNVLDSGSYFCKLTFAYKGDFVTVNTPNISVLIDKCPVKAPELPPMQYEGEVIYPTLAENPLYKSNFAGAINVGLYPVTLILSDAENYRWENTDSDTVTLDFEIVAANNEFIIQPSVSDGYEGGYPTVTASAKFGETEYLYSSDGISYTEGLPISVGKYYLKAFVRGTENYTELVSEPIPFSVLPELVIGITMDVLPDKTVYTAFDKIDLNGGVFTVTYNSGRSVAVSNSELNVIYKRGECLLAADTSVAVCYAGVSCPLEVSVLPASYDISAIRFENSSVIYNSLYNTVSAEGSVVGLDGIPLSFSVKGGGINVGVYTVTLTFSTESPNYTVPDDVIKTLTVMPCPISVSYNTLEFVYDGTPKLPAASAEGIIGNLLEVRMSGAATDAGEYVACASLVDKNYTIINPSVNYTIRKADIDLSGVYWSDGSLIYNGARQSVEIFGLPRGVFAVGYANASFTDAGDYTAEAILSFDAKNYNSPPPVTFEWSIAPAEYDFSACKFIDSEYVYDGQIHYPKMLGSIPVGYDSSSPSYVFSNGVTHVSEGRMCITVTFTSGSKNYLTPAPVSAYVSVLPKSVTVEWQNTLFTYDGSYRIPTAVCGECEVSVTGGGVDSGEYIAEAFAENSDYFVENGKIAFRINKRENLWLTEPGIPNFYTSGEARPYGVAYFGEVEYSYYLDEALSSRIDYPSSAGVYYMLASVPESKNYFNLESSAIKFSVVEVLPVSLEVKFLTEQFFAMSKISAKDVSAYYVNNDGTVMLLPFDNVEVVYSDGESLKFSDSTVTFRVSEFSYTAPISVKKASYDMSGVHWLEEHHIYDGSPKSAYIAGLPDGVTLVEYTLPSAISAGTYRLSAVLDFDRENYNAPVVPDGWLIIDKCPIDLPSFGSFEYDGKSHAPRIPESPLYVGSADSGISVGKYRVLFTLTDSANYEFRDGISEKYYEIVPREVTVEINPDRKSYKVVSGSIADGDGLSEEFYSDGEYVYMRSRNGNYRVSVIPIREKGFADYLPLILILLLLFVLITLGVYIYWRHPEIIPAFVGAIKERFEKNGKQESNAPKNDGSHLEMLMMVDESCANALISDSIAKSLISNVKDSIVTNGKSHAIVNIDTISETFSSGDTVDINKMKEKGLIPKDSFTVKVLARGVIDKPLTVLANSFSICAVKMIALTGGEAKRVATAKNKRIKRDDFKNN